MTLEMKLSWECLGSHNYDILQIYIVGPINNNLPFIRSRRTAVRSAKFFTMTFGMGVLK